MSELKELSAQSVEVTDDGEASLVIEATDGKRFKVAVEPVEVEETPAEEGEPKEEGEGESKGEGEGETPPIPEAV